jgi:hypothetical protein
MKRRRSAEITAPCHILVLKNTDMAEIPPPGQNNEELQPDSSESCMRWLERSYYIVLFCFGLILALTAAGFAHMDCVGPGAQFPGGCPEWSAAVEGRLLVLTIVEMLLLIIILSRRIRAGILAQIIIFVLFSLVLLFGWILIFALPLPPKVVSDSWMIRLTEM